MDPYLEEPSLWPDFHARLVQHVHDTLNNEILPLGRYIARTERHIWIENE
ncbi:MAG: DUF4058 family protein, partial [Gemmataceae bacterium]